MKVSATLLALGVLVCTIPKDCQNVLNASYDHQHSYVQVTCGNSDGNGSTYLSLISREKGSGTANQVDLPDRITYRRGDTDKIECN